MDVSVGVDTHKSTFSAAAVDLTGRQLSARDFRNDRRGQEEFMAWLEGISGEKRVGIECCGSYGANLAKRLLESGEDVRAVPTALAYREARRKQSAGKADPSDALAIARVTLREESLRPPRNSEATEELRLLSEYRDQLVCEKTQLANRIHKDLVYAYPGYEKTIGKINNSRSLKAVMALIRGDNSTRAEFIRKRVKRIRALLIEIEQIDARIKAELEKTDTSLLQVPGVGTKTAATILGRVGDVREIRSKAAFANLTGTAPIPASSGQTVRHRLNRGGDRKLNCALHRIALTQYRVCPEAKAYIERKRSEGKSFKEAIRCLKRQMSNVVYARLREDAAKLTT